MKLSYSDHRAICISIAAAILAGCGGSQPPIGAPGAMPQSGAIATQMGGRHEATAFPIHHVIVVVRVGRSFDNLFAGYPGEYPRTGLHHITLQTNGERDNGVTLPESYRTFRTEWDFGKMNGFDKIHFGADGKGAPAHHYPYAYVAASETKPYWNLAQPYAMADEMFSTEQAGSFAASLVLIAGSTALFPATYVVGVTAPGGCDAPPRTRTILAGLGHRFGPHPCFHWETMADLLDANNVSWKYYTLLCSGSHGDPGCLWNAFEAIKAVRNGRDWSRNISVPNTNLFSDLKKRSFPAVSWITPTLADSDDSASGTKSGPGWVTSIVDAVRASRYWKSTAIIIVWTDWGGYFDNAPPPALDFIGLSFRVPMIVVSPYAKKGYVSHTQYELASVLKFIEENWDLGYLGTTDVRAQSIVDMFDF